MHLIRAAVSTVLFLAFSTQASANNITMVCDADDDGKRYYKYVDPWLGKSSIEQKVFGVWKDWCRPTENSVCEVEIYESGAKLDTTKTGYTSHKDSVADGLKKGDKLIYRTMIVIDFEFETRRIIRWYSDLEGNKVFKKLSIDTTYPCEIQ